MREELLNRLDEVYSNIDFNKVKLDNELITNIYKMIRNVNNNKDKYLAELEIIKLEKGLICL